MANLWDNMDDESRNIIINAHLNGAKKDNANLNRAREQLANNPNLVARLAEEEGLDLGQDAELDDTDPDAETSLEEEANDIEQNVNASLDDANVQETGSVSGQSDIPPPEPGESISEYMDRLAFLQDSAMKSDGTQDLIEDVDQDYDRSNPTLRQTMEDLHYPEDEKEGDKAARMRNNSAEELVAQDMIYRDMAMDQSGRRRGPTGSYSDEYRRRERSRKR